MEKSTLRRFDLVTSILLFIGSIFYIFESISLLQNPYGYPAEMLTPEKVQGYLEKWTESPALLPLVVGILLLVASVILFIIAIKDGARFDFFTKEKFVAAFHNKELRVFCVVVAYLAIYIWVLAPICRANLNFFPKFQGFPFAIATTLYVYAMMMTFETKRTKKQFLISFIIAICASFFIVIMFNLVAKLPML